LHSLTHGSFGESAIKIKENRKQEAGLRMRWVCGAIVIEN